MARCSAHLTRPRTGLSIPDSKARSGMNTMLGPLLSLLIPVVAAAAPLGTTEKPALAPGVRYDPQVPTVKQVLGFDVGERITSPEQITAYLKALQAAAPERTRLIEYARTWEGRPLQVLVVGSAE